MPKQSTIEHFTITMGFVVFHEIIRSHWNSIIEQENLVMSIHITTLALLTSMAKVWQNTSPGSLSSTDFS